MKTEFRMKKKMKRRNDTGKIVFRFFFQLSHTVHKSFIKMISISTDSFFFFFKLFGRIDSHVVKRNV